jgi:hypothetical protein
MRAFKLFGRVRISLPRSRARRAIAGQYRSRWRDAKDRFRQFLPRHPHSLPDQCSASRDASHRGQIILNLIPRCRPRTVGIGHSPRMTSTSVPATSITTAPAPVRVSRAERAWAGLWGHLRSTLLPILGMAFEGNRRQSSTRRRFGYGVLPAPKLAIAREILFWSWPERKRPSRAAACQRRP